MGDLVEGLCVGLADIPLGRLVEGHVDAVWILAQAGAEPRAGARYGVWASRSAVTRPRRLGWVAPDRIW